MLGRRSGVLRAAFVFVLAAFVVPGCSGCSSLPESPNVPPSSRPSFGELVYRVIRQQLQLSDTCPQQYVAELEQHHTDFVTTFDYVIENGVQDDFPDLLGGTIKPFVDNDKLPRLVDTLAEALALLVSDEFDPNRDTIQAFVNLSEAQTLLESSMAIQLVAAILEDPTITDKVHALAVIAQENDGVTYLMDDMLDVASFALAEDPTPSSCTGLTLGDAQTTLLRTQGFVEDARFALGSPFYIARPDANGNPAVRSYGGTLAAPFVDADSDGVADVNADGEPVDANGQLVDLPMVGEDSAPGRDVYGRAVDAQNRVVYDYYDVKRTALSYAVQVGADLFEDGLHHQLPPIATAVLGPPVTCNDGTVNCRYYSSNNNLVADLLWVAFEAAEYGRMSVMLRTLATLLETNPTQSEQLLVAVGDVIRALDATNIQLTDTSITDAVLGLLPMLEQIFESPSQNSLSTARVLVDVLQGLGAQADALPSDINYMVRNQWDPDAPNDTEAVNLSLARFPAGGDDNRTGLEQLIELFEYADCGYVGPDGILTLRNTFWLILRAFDSQVSPGTLAEVFVDILSRQTPSTVSSLVGLLNSIQNLVGNGLLSWVIETATGCSAADSDKTAQHLPSLSILAASGGLDWILPLANTFKQQGQLRLLIDIFGYIARELRYDEDASATTVSAVRRLMPVINTLTTAQTAGVATSTPLNRILDTLDILIAIPASDGNGNSLDVMIDTISFMSNTTTVQTRTSNVTNTSILGELLKVVRTMQMRIASGGASDELTRVVDGITPLLTQTTGSGTSRRLTNPNLRVLAATLLSVAANAAMLPTNNYLCYVRDAQSETRDFLLGKHFATAVRIFNHLATSPNAAALESWVLSMMRGKPADRTGEIYGRALQIVAGGLSTDAAGEDLAQITNWLSAGLTVTGAGGLREMVATLDELLASDTEGTMLTMVRTVIEPGPLASGERPISTFAEVASDVSAVDAANMCMATGTNLDAAAIEEVVDGLASFLLRNPNDGITTGIEQVWQLVGSIAPTE